MKLFNRSDRKRITSETKEEKELPGLRGPLTARQALNAIVPVVREIDEEFILTFVGSQEGIMPDGGSYGWDFFFEFPRREGLANFSVHLCPSEGDDEGPWCLDMRVRPLGRSPKQPALPLSFRDSAEAVQSLAREGADFISGDSHMTLSVKSLASGAVVWHTICWDREYTTPFA